MLTKQSTVGTYLLHIASLTYQLERLTMLVTTLCGYSSFLIFTFVGRIFSNIFNDFDNAYILWNIVSNTLPYNYIIWTLRTLKHSSISLNNKSTANTFLTESMPALRNHPRRPIIKIIVIMTNDTLST